jgi:hypothetical protein
MKRFIVYFIILTILTNASAQISTHEKPISFKFNIDNVTKNSTIHKVLPEISLKRLQEEDMSDEENGLPPRFGYKHQVNFDMQNSGEWTTLPSGDKIWRLYILCPNALSINLLYNKFWLPENSKLFIYEANKESYIGAFTSKNNTGTKNTPTGFATGLLYGDEIVVEYYQPKEVKESAIISIEYVVQGYRQISIGGTKVFGGSLSCNINVNCPEGSAWQEEKNAVALIVVNGNRICSGSLINNTEEDYAPYFLTANHCILGFDAETNPNLYYYSFYWHYEHPECINSSIEPVITSTVGATIKANKAYSDFALLELTEDPFEDYYINPYYLGWDNSGTSSENAVGIHHPAGDVKKICIETSSPTSYSNLIDWNDGSQSQPGTHWKAVFDYGTAEGGSSGSPLINNNHHVIGQLHGGEFGCPPVSKYYGKFSLSWAGESGDSNMRKLQTWLDPDDTDIETLDGLGYCNIVTNYHSNCQISGSTSFSACSPPVTYSLIGSVLSNCGVRWETSSNLQITGSSRTNAIVVPIGVGTGWVKVHIFKGPDCEVVFQRNITISNPVSAQTSHSNTVIDQTQVTWSSDALLGGTITINPSCTLTITSNIYCFPNSEIVVEPGGKLVIDGGTLTKLCGALWNGILVVGNKNQRQLAQYQGTVETKNGARIEYSKNAICTWDGTDYNTTGGIIKASNTTFSNNIKSIEFKEYINYNIVGGVANNISYINNCNFTIDNGLLLYTSSYLNSHIVFQGIRGIKVSGTSFKNESTNQSNNGYGIYSNSSGFTVTESCSTGVYNSTNCTCTGTTISSSFENLNTCIKVLNDGSSTNTITVNHSEFEDFYDGINISATNNFFITQSSFKLQSGTIFGIKLQNCTGYKIEENDFFSNYFWNPNGSTMTGIYVNNSGTSENLIYRNTFTNVYKGITTFGTNGRSSLPYSGLQFKCNVFQNTFYSDIYCNSIIRRDQGSSSIGADNDFMKGIALDYYLNLYYPSSIPQVTYFYSTDILHDPSTTTNVSKSNVITGNSCTSTLCEFVINPKTLSFSTEYTDDLESNDNFSDIVTFESLYDTYSLLVSDFIESDYCFLVENNFDNIEAEIIDIVNQELDSISYLSFLMKDLSDKNIHRIMVDSVFDINELNGWYQRVDALHSKYFLANNYFELKEYEHVWSILDYIPTQFDLSIEELQEYDNFRTFNSFRENVFSSDRNYWQLDSVEIALLETIAANSNGLSGEFSKNILCFYYEIGCLEEDVIADDFINNKNVTDVHKNTVDNNPSVFIYPNPVKDNVNILINKIEISKASVEFFNILGYIVLSESLNLYSNVIDLSQLPAGAYYFTINYDNQIIHRGKLIKE